MDVVDTWTGHHASALRQALRLTNEGFADRIGTVVRTVAKWNATPDMVLTIELQRALDTILTQAPTDVRSRFALLLRGDTSLPPVEMPAAPEIPADEHTSAALEWLDRTARWPAGASRARVAGRLEMVSRAGVERQRAVRTNLSREAVANSLAAYYRTSTPWVLHTARVDGVPVSTSVLTRPTWLDLRLPLGVGRDTMALSPLTYDPPGVDEYGALAAVDRLASGVATDLRIVNAPLYRLRRISVSPEGINGEVGIAAFLDYALTFDLLEGELSDALVNQRESTPGSLPLRDRYLPTIAAVTNVDDRLCAGGALSLFAVARPARRARNGRDYLILIQERSPQVLNAARRIAVIPKSFHGPLVDYSEDAQIYRTIEREMEEELFGRDDVDSVFTHHQRSADPMHPSRLSAPMRWLAEHPDPADWSMECTAVGFNLVSGNYEIANLIAIHNESWWEQYGGDIAANWESGSIRRYSTLDRDSILTLIHDPAWSNEGLFAALQGIRRLAEIGGNRVDLPSIEWEARD
ncbi:hypothetical protein [Cryptosporangium aurantiacum]|uniref:Uncharacterized protein n=1 Tax=Cryptosporangium aurantiacum TaxID=134849 RepID=A0A1M7NMY2_9ACTN|nr:hypothetical protein [Cryptosporangium aurantiacum]SHN05145.1 hypothetical protein SAMN05443668_102728 [Cryptosporangium aurantiacum]